MSYYSNNSTQVVMQIVNPEIAMKMLQRESQNDPQQKDQKAQDEPQMEDFDANPAKVQESPQGKGREPKKRQNQGKGNPPSKMRKVDEEEEEEKLLRQVIHAGGANQEVLKAKMNKDYT